MADPRKAVSDLFALVRDQGKRISAIESGEVTPQLTRSSIDNGSLPVYDADGFLRMRIGLQGDGTFGLSAPTASEPGKPSTPVLTPAVKGLRVSWDGCLEGSVVPPADFSHVEVHVSDDGLFYPNPDTLHGVLYATGSVTVAPLDSVVQYARLVGVNASGDTGEPSDVATATPSEVVAESVLDGIITTVKLAEDAVTEAKIAASAVTETKIADDSISTPKIIAGAVQTESIAAGAVMADTIAAGAVTTEKLEALSVTADKIAANAITAGKIDAGAVTAGTIDVGAVTANTLESQLQLASEIIAGDPDTSHLSLTGDGLLAYDETGNPTLSISSMDGSIQMVGGLQTDLTGAGWSIGPGGLFVTPGTNLESGPIGNTPQQVAWQDESALYAFLEARSDGSFHLQNNAGDTVLRVNDGNSVRVEGGSLTGRVESTFSTHRRHASFSDTVSADSGDYGHVVSHLSVQDVNIGGDIVWDPINGGFSITKDGLYNLSATFIWNSAGATGWRYTELYNSTQGVVIVSARESATGTFNDQAISVAAYPLYSGDFVQLRVEHTAEGTLGFRPSGNAAPASVAIQYVSSIVESAPDPYQTLIVPPISTDSYQYGRLNAWRSGDYVYQGDGGGGNHRGMFFYGPDAFAVLEGKVIDKVSMYVRRSAAEGSNAAVEPHLRAHIYAENPRPATPSQPTDYPGYGLLPGFKKGTYRNVDLPLKVATDLSGGVWQGLMFETGGAGFSRWTGHSDTANGTLTITYHDAPELEDVAVLPETASLTLE